MLDEPRRYPMLRGRRRRRLPRLSLPAIDRRRVAFAAVAALALVLGIIVVRHARAPDPTRELATSIALFEAGNYSAAREHAQLAARVSGWGLADAMAARADLALRDGPAAEAALTAAASAGFDMARGHQMLAEAYLLEGDTDRAIAEAAKAPPRFAAYATRVHARALAAKGDAGGGERLLLDLVARAPRNTTAWSDLARIRFDDGDIAGADFAARHALALTDAPLAALVVRGEIVRSRFGLVAALPWFAAALQHDAYYPPALIDQAATLGEAGRYTEMLDASRRLLAARPGDPAGLYLQAVLAARAGNRELAEALIARTGGAMDHVPGMLLLSGGLDYADGRFEQAIEKWRELLARQPMNTPARQLLGAALLRSGDAKGALDTLRPIAVRADADSYTLGLVGRAFEANGQRDWAATYLDRAAAPPGGSATPFGSEDTVGDLADAAARAPRDPGAAVALIRGLLAAGNEGGALARAEALVRASPGAPAAYLLLGDTLAATGRTDAGIAAYRRAADLRFDEPVLLRLVETLERAGHGDQAAQTLALYLSQNPASETALRLLGRAQLGAGQWDAVATTLVRLQALGGGRDALLLAELATAYAGAGDADAALRTAQAAYRLQPLNRAVAAVYAQALVASGQRAAAAQLAAKAGTLR